MYAVATPAAFLLVATVSAYLCLRRKKGRAKKEKKRHEGTDEEAWILLEDVK